MEAAPNPDGAPDPTQAENELPIVESPPLSPGTEMSAIASDTRATQPRAVLKARHQRYALVVATMAIAAALGAVVGALASSGFTAPVPPDVAAIEANKAMQQSIARQGNHEGEPRGGEQGGAPRPLLFRIVLSAKSNRN